MKKIILGIGILVVLIGGYMTYQLQKDDNHFLQGKSSAEYYQNLRKDCRQKNSKNCCLASLKRMEKLGAHKVSTNGVCDYGYKKGTMKCIDSFTWCEKVTINDTSKFAFYKRLRDRCKITGSTNPNQLSCCLDSVKAMEIVGSTKLLPRGDYKKHKTKFKCPDSLKKMTLRCPGSYTWCQTSNNPEDEDFVPVSMNEPRIKPNHPEISGLRFDNSGDNPICTADAKDCGNGTENIKEAKGVVINEDDVDLNIEIDLSNISGKYKDLLGVNKSPYMKTRDNTKEINLSNIYKMLDLSEIRIHDDGVDISEIYQDDAVTETTSTPKSIIWNVNNIRNINNIRNYDFTEADKVIKIAINTGAKIYLRLGESWLGPNNTENPRVFAIIANNIYKHYIGNFGSNLVLPKISAVEVYNEPDGRFWTGDNENLHSLVRNTVKKVRLSNSTEKIGGAGFVGKVNEHFNQRNSVVNKFIENVGAENLDFFSAHYYGKCENEKLENFIDWSEVLRENLNRRGMSDKEIHLTEWNIGAGNSCTRRDKVVYELPKMFTYTAGLLLLAQENKLNIEHAHFYAGNGSAMSILTLNQRNLTILINKVFMSFYLHKQFKNMDKVKTKICNDSTCLGSYKNVKEGNGILAQTFKDESGFKILIINDSNDTKSIRINLSNLENSIKESHEIKYQLPEELVYVNLEKKNDGMYSIDNSDVVEKMINKSISRRDLDLNNNKDQSFLIQLSPYSASVIDIINN